MLDAVWMGLFWCLLMPSSMARLPLMSVPVSISSTKACYLFLLSESMVSPHCVEKFAGVFGALDWRATWRSLLFFDLDRQVVDLS